MAVNPFLLQPLRSYIRPECLERTIPLPNGFCGLVGQILLIVCKICMVQFAVIYYAKIWICYLLLKKPSSRVNLKLFGYLL